MRVIYAFFLMAFFSGALYAQESVPDVLKKAFAERFPDATSVEWEDPEDGVFEVEFEQESREMTASFDADGAWLETEAEIAEGDLPEAVQRTLVEQFAGYEADKVEWVSTPERALAYEVKLEEKDSDTELKVVFSPEGEVLSKEVKTEEE